MSAAIQFDLSDLKRVNRKLGALAQMDTRGLMDAVGLEVESQTQLRISEHGPAPDGSAWEPWADDYAAQRPPKGGLLELGGDLRETITYAVGVHGSFVDVGSNLPYAAIHQFGGKPGMAPGPAAIPARPYLGLSTENESDVRVVVNDWLDGQMRRQFA